MSQVKKKRGRPKSDKRLAKTIAVRLTDQQMAYLEPETGLKRAALIRSLIDAAIKDKNKRSNQDGESKS